MRLVCSEMKTFSTIKSVSFESELEINFMVKLVEKYVSIRRIYMQSRNFQTFNTLRSILQNYFFPKNIHIDLFFASSDVSKSLKQLQTYFYFLWISKEFQIIKTTLISNPNVSFLASTQYLTHLYLENAFSSCDYMLLNNIPKIQVLKQIKEFKLRLGKVGLNHVFADEYLFSKVFYNLNSVMKVHVAVQNYACYNYYLFSMICYNALVSGMLTRVKEATVQIYNRYGSSDKVLFLNNALKSLRKCLAEIVQVPVMYINYGRTPRIYLKTKE
eukprot:snap_masked-scaffold_18-processed-gene-1.18-mRNA-1 protein AED:1.00 eAED:1.00 QI:0/0/0/0/1/1/2/0/271